MSKSDDHVFAPEQNDGSSKHRDTIPCPPAGVTENSAQARAQGTRPLPISVIIPTYQRRESARRALQALAHQDIGPEQFEVVLVVDGSSDGTAAMAQGLDMPYRLHVISQRNSGRATACNRGAAEATGELLVLLDDDMEAHPGLLSAHLRAHAASPTPLGVLGAVPITGTKSFVEEKFNRHLEYLAASGEITKARDVYTGNFSVRRDIFIQLGCFDEVFTEYGNEDVELGVRLRHQGVRLVYSREALARQHHTKTLSERARDARSKGRTAVLLSNKHPACWNELALADFHRASPPWRVLRSLLLRMTRACAPIEKALVSTASVLSRHHRTERLLLDYCFWVGVSSVKPLGEAIVPPSPAAATREEDLNRLLRRVDWRFLTSDPTLAGAEAIAGPELTAAVRLLSRDSRPGHSIILQDPDADTLRGAGARLAPGATLYVEWTRPLAGGMRAAARRIEAAGLKVDARLWVWPIPPRLPRAWLPLGSPGAIRWFAEPRLRVPGQSGHGAKSLLRSIWRSIASTGMLPPYCLLASKPGGATDSTATELATDRAHTLMITAGQRSIGKVVLITFPDGNDPPQAAVKFSRTAAAEEGLNREEMILREIERRRPDLHGVPRVLFRRSWGAGRALGETVVRGVPLQRILGNVDDERLFSKVTDWALALAGSEPAQPPGDWWERLVDTTLHTFREQFGSVADAELIAESERCLRACGPMPLVIEHRDLGPWNILLDGSNHIQVLDWESAELRGLPGLDLIYFFAFAGFAIDRAESLGAKIQSYHRSLDHDSPMGQARSSFLKRYLNQLGIPEQELPALTLLTWLVHTRSDFRRLLEDMNGRPSREAMLNSTFLALWEVQARSLRSSAAASL